MVPSDTSSAFHVPAATPASGADPREIAAAWLAVEAGQQHYLLALGDTGEIFPWTLPQPVPHTVAWFLGVANLRGGLYGVVRLEAFVAADADPDDVAAMRRSAEAPAPAPTRLVALHARFDVNCALQVDRVLGLRSRELFEPVHVPGAGAEPAAEPGIVPAWHARRFVDAAGTHWQALDLQTLARHPRFLNVGTRPA